MLSAKRSHCFREPGLPVSILSALSLIFRTVPSVCTFFFCLHILVVRSKIKTHKKSITHFMKLHFICTNQ